LQGLRILHKSNIIHRDIKSANIIFVKGVAKLGDLNVSKFTEDGFCSTQTGTPTKLVRRYGHVKSMEISVIFGLLGCIIYEMCTLKVQFRASDFLSLYRRITKG
jgi:serine/threonine protein kinase